jgi:hypothetical protein
MRTLPDVRAVHSARGTCMHAAIADRRSSLRVPPFLKIDGQTFDAMIRYMSKDGHTYGVKAFRRDGIYAIVVHH